MYTSLKLQFLPCSVGYPRRKTSAGHRGPFLFNTLAMNLLPTL